MPKILPKIIAIIGQTAAGKSDIAVKIAIWLSLKQAKKKFNINGAEIISADSRQVYRKMDIGTGKITKKEMRDIPHYLLDVASPKRKFNVSQYKKLAENAIKKIIWKEKIPIICGGTGFYIQVLLDNPQIPEVKPDWKLRKKLEKKTTAKLLEMLKKLDPNRAKNIDAKNPRRLIRAIEIVLKTGKPAPKIKFKKRFDVLMIGIKKSPQELKQQIKKRLLKRFDQGMVAEVKKLRESGVSWKRLEEFGLEYRFIAKFLQKKINYKEMVDKLQKDIENFAKRQMTWFKKDKRIYWVKNCKKAENLIGNFLKI